jgi:hypothetical protein
VHIIDDILIIYNAQTTNINMTHPKIKFIMEEEQNNKINYVDINTQDHTEYFAYFPSPLSIPHCGFLLRLHNLELQRYALSPPLLDYPLTIKRNHDSTRFNGK